MLKLKPGDEVQVDGKGEGVVRGVHDIGVEVLEVEIGERVVFVAAAAVSSTRADILRRLRT